MTLRTESRDQRLRNLLRQLTGTRTHVQIPVPAVTHTIPLRPDPSTIHHNGQPLRPSHHQLTNAELPHEPFRDQKITFGVLATTEISQDRTHAGTGQDDAPTVTIPINVGVVHSLRHQPGVVLQARTVRSLKFHPERHLRIPPQLGIPRPKHRINKQSSTRTMRTRHLTVDLKPRLKALQHPIRQLFLRGEALQLTLLRIPPPTHDPRIRSKRIQLARKRPKRRRVMRNRFLHTASLTDTDIPCPPVGTQKHTAATRGLQHDRHTRPAPPGRRAAHKDDAMLLDELHQALTRYVIRPNRPAAYAGWRRATGADFGPLHHDMSPDEAHATITSGLTAGTRNPRQLHPRKAA